MQRKESPKADAEFRLYNTMSRSVEPFTPADGTTVRMYSCGPTVYNPAHLGNFRTFLFNDLLRRAFKLRGWKVDQVMNLTDVDDKIIKRADAQGKNIRQVTGPVTEVFFADRDFLRIQPAEHSRCHPGRPRPHGESHAADVRSSSSFADFQSAKSWAFSFV